MVGFAVSARGCTLVQAFLGHRHFGTSRTDTPEKSTDGDDDGDDDVSGKVCFGLGGRVEENTRGEISGTHG